ncbi:MAG: hypothetical protein WA945_07735 [Arcobacteraceae bacterium]
MKTTRFNFEKAVQEVKLGATQWLKDEFKDILESDKEFTRKGDYIGYSITAIDNKIDSLDEEITLMQQLKKNLKSAKDITLEVGATVFAEYGIEKLEGAGISSITLTKATNSQQTQLEVTDEAMLIRAGFTKTVLDIDLVNKRYQAGEYLDIIKAYTKVTTVNKSKPARLKINKRRTAVNSNTLLSKDEVLALEVA